MLMHLALEGRRREEGMCPVPPRWRAWTPPQTVDEWQRIRISSRISSSCVPLRCLSADGGRGDGAAGPPRLQRRRHRRVQLLLGRVRRLVRARRLLSPHAAMPCFLPSALHFSACPATTQPGRPASRAAPCVAFFGAVRNGLWSASTAIHAAAAAAACHVQVHRGQQEPCAGHAGGRPGARGGHLRV